MLRKILPLVAQMPSSPSNLPDPIDASKTPVSGENTPKNLSPKKVDTQAVETFAFDVTAGSPANVEDAELPASTTPKPNSRTTSRATQPLEVVPPNNESIDFTLKKGASPKGPSVEEPRKTIHEKPPEEPAPVLVDLPAQIDIQQEAEPASQAVGTARRVARQFSWWITSLGVHVLLLVCLAFSTLAVMQEEEIELYASPAVYETVEEFEDLEIDPTDELDSLDEELDAELNTPDPDTLANLGSETLLEEPALSEPLTGETASADATSSLAELGQLFGDDGTGMSGLDNEIGIGAGGAMAKFFGTEIKARRILYMLDNSGGMRKGGKFEALVSELQASVSRLQPKQKFYIVFYSDTVYPLFFPYSVREFVKSTPKSQKKLAAWLDSVELCGGNAIDEALAAAEVIRPDAIFLLTDGDLFTTSKKKTLLLNSARRSYAIHTFGLGVGKQTKTAEGLKQVAEANGGTFRAIKVTDEMKERAKEKERPYHNKKPGPVWGLKVGSR